MNTSGGGTNRPKRKAVLLAASGVWALLLLSLAASNMMTHDALSAAAVQNTEAVPAFNEIQKNPAESYQPIVINTPAASTPVPEPPPTESPAAAKAVDSLASLNEQYSSLGTITVAGMTPDDYERAMDISWIKIETPGEPEAYNINISSLMDYEAIEKYILNLGRYEGVEISVIGESEQGRNIYMVEINLPGGEENRPVIMLSGGVHAREFAGTDYMIKFLNDTLKKAETDEYTRVQLQSVTIAAVPLVNPDGRELAIAEGDGERKANANGVDINRQMPSVNAGQLAAGQQKPEESSDEPGLAYFAGYSLGSESETQAMIKWMNVYVPQAAAYIDLHQMGGITLCDKTFLSSGSDALCLEFAEQTNSILENGYEPWPEKEAYGLNGDGGTMTDYARSVAEGFVYSYRLGRMALLMDGEELPLLCFRDLDNFADYYIPVNPAFKSITIEIGRSAAYLGPGQKALNKREEEYKKYGWNDFLTGTIENLLGEEKVN